MKKALFIDRDGTILVEPQPSQQIDALTPDKFQFVPGAISGLARIAAELDFELVLVSNQDGLGTASFPEETFWPAHRLMLDVLAAEGVGFAREHIDRSFAHDNRPTRKPGLGMLGQYLGAESGYDLANSYVIGDRLTDVALARNLGCGAILLQPDAEVEAEDEAEVGVKTEAEADERAALTTPSWARIVEFLRLPPRTALVQRDTAETQIRVALNLDGQGRPRMQTGLGFFDHMLDQLSKHSGVDMDITVRGDLHIDEHHTIEDTALALGEAFALALGDKRGLARYGFLLPMDDALAQAALDFSGRPWLVWEAEFKREKIGDMPTEMFYHFFKSFCDAARCNLHLKAEGQNEHHKIEAIFKAVAKALKMALVRDAGRMEIPSTKGSL